MLLKYGANVNEKDGVSDLCDPVCVCACVCVCCVCLCVCVCVCAFPVGWLVGCMGAYMCVTYNDNC